MKRRWKGKKGSGVDRIKRRKWKKGMMKKKDEEEEEMN